jgi:hypothetical protein
MEAKMNGAKLKRFLIGCAGPAFFILVTWLAIADRIRDSTAKIAASKAQAAAEACEAWRTQPDRYEDCIGAYAM